jgi:hypothetical protein
VALARRPEPDGEQQLSHDNFFAGNHRLLDVLRPDIAIHGVQDYLGS